MARRRMSNPLALAVLACLVERPMHPYEISTTLRSRGKEQSIKLNYGSLYSVVESLEKHGLIRARETTREPRLQRRELTDRYRYQLREPVLALDRTCVGDLIHGALGSASLSRGFAGPDQAVLLQRLDDRVQRPVVELDALFLAPAAPVS